MQTAKFIRKPFEVEAVQVTAENISEVAAWCKGEVHQEENTETAGDAYVKVTVARALNERQTKAFVGDWVLQAGTGFKVYTSKAFSKSFEIPKGVTIMDPNEDQSDPDMVPTAVQAKKTTVVPGVDVYDEVPTSSVTAGSSTSAVAGPVL